MKNYTTLPQTSYLSPLALRLPCRYGHGLFAKSFIKKGTLLIDWTNGPGVLMSSKESYALEFAGNHFTLQVDEDKHLVSLHAIEDCDYINHSCDPNSGFGNLMQIVAMRDIQKGEEITFDYAMSETSSLFLLHCDCNNIYCRKVIQGSDWARKDLQLRYGPYFSEYVRKKIELQQAALNTSIIREDLPWTA